MTDHLDRKNEADAKAFLARHTDDELSALLNLYASEYDPVIWDSNLRLALYLKLREEGAAEVWAKGRACRTFARRTNSDGAFHEHARRRMQNWPKWRKDAYFKMAKEAGISTHGKYHVSGIGPPEDPEAWVSGPEDIRDVAKRRNLTVTGHVNHEGQPMPAKVTPLADDLVDEMVQQEMKADPSVAERCRRSSGELSRLRGLVREKYGPRASALGRRIEA